MTGGARDALVAAVIDIGSNSVLLLTVAVAALGHDGVRADLGELWG